MATNIQVAVRVRPFLPFEAGAKSCIEVLPGEGKSVRIVSNPYVLYSNKVLLLQLTNQPISFVKFISA